jgi:CBS domain-containing protein
MVAQYLLCLRERWTTHRLRSVQASELLEPHPTYTVEKNKKNMEAIMAATRWEPVKVQEIMHREVRRTNPDMSLEDAARKMRDMDIGCLPVCENEELIGVITDRDIICRVVAETRDPATITVRDVMSKDVAFCFEDQSAMDAAQLMREKHVRRLPVFDHDNHMVGMLTLSDLSVNAPELSGEVVRSLSFHH